MIPEEILMTNAALFSIALSGLLIALSASSSAPTPETRRIPQFENERVKVWKSLLLPNQPLPPHRHEHGENG